MRRPDASIIIPTHNRRDAAVRALRALSLQCCPRTSFEVILVADGCSDGTAGLRTGEWPMPVRVLEQPHAGPAAARNRGAAAATGDLLIFLDDDIEALPGFVAAHIAAHEGHEAHEADPVRQSGLDRQTARTTEPAGPRREPDSVVIGYLPPELQGRRDLFAVMLRAWWEAMFERMRDPGHRFRYSDLLSGNFSLRRELFEQSGGFDETLHCHEDYELGYRLIAAGARFRFAPAAAGWHHEHTDLARALRRKRDEGRADVALARRYPELIPALPLARPQMDSSRRGRMLRSLAVAHPAIGDVVEGLCRRVLVLLETARLRTRWRRLLDDLLSYWYWRGVAESPGGTCARGRFAAPEVPSVLHALDLQHGLALAAAEIDAVGPQGLSLRWGPLVIGAVPPEPGAEPLQGRHLRSLLRGRFLTVFRQTLALAHGEPVTGGGASEQPHPLARLDDRR
jgi:GT2 family glycosyltransferase